MLLASAKASLCSRTEPQPLDKSDACVYLELNCCIGFHKRNLPRWYAKYVYTEAIILTLIPQQLRTQTLFTPYPPSSRISSQNSPRTAIQSFATEKHSRPTDGRPRLRNEKPNVSNRMHRGCRVTVAITKIPRAAAGHRAPNI